MKCWNCGIILEEIEYDESDFDEYGNLIINKDDKLGTRDITCHNCNSIIINKRIAQRWRERNCVEKEEE